MKIVAYMALHYGVEYLQYAVRSVIDYVDEFWFLYSPVGSHGHRVDDTCPDSEDALHLLAKMAAGDKCRWVEHDNWRYEGQQRDAILDLAPDADAILVVDADEIWAGVNWTDVVKTAYTGGWHRIRLPIIHFWRSFYHCVLYDDALPERIIFPQLKGDPSVLVNVPAICHMGYAQRPELVEYKMKVHGHKNELRTDINWFEERFLKHASEDCHPVGSDKWNTDIVFPPSYIPGFMVLHPYAELTRIEDHHFNELFLPYLEKNLV